MDSNAAINSATTTESQIPSRPISLGNKITAAIWKTMVRKKDIIAETRPLFSAVKKDDPKIANPAKRKENEKMKKAFTVISHKPWSYPTKISDKGFAKRIPAKSIKSEETEIITRLFFKTLFSSALLSAPKLYPIIGAEPTE